MERRLLSPLVIALWLGNVVFDTVGQLAFKAAAVGAPEAEGRWRGLLGSPYLWLGLGCYVGEFLAWIAFLSLVPLSEGVLLGSINIVAVMIAGRLLFAEKLTRLRLCGILLVAAGVALVGVG